MSIATETACEYFGLAQKAADRGDVREALHYSDREQLLLLRQSGDQNNVPIPNANKDSNAFSCEGR